MSGRSFYESWRAFFYECRSLKLDLEVAAGLEKPIEGMKKSEKITCKIKPMLINICKEIRPDLTSSDVITLNEVEDALVGELDEINYLIEKFQMDQTLDIRKRSSSAQNFWGKISYLYEKWFHYTLELLEPFRDEVNSLHELRNFTIESSSRMSPQIEADRKDSIDFKFPQPIINQKEDKLSQSIGCLDLTSDLISRLSTCDIDLDRARSDTTKKYEIKEIDGKISDDSRYLMKIHCTAKEVDAIRSLISIIGGSNKIETETKLDYKRRTHKSDLKITPIRPIRAESHSLNLEQHDLNGKRISRNFSVPLNYPESDVSVSSNQRATKKLPLLPKRNIMEKKPEPSRQPASSLRTSKPRKKFFVRGRNPEKPNKELEISLPYQVEHKCHVNHDLETGKLTLENLDVVMRKFNRSRIE